MIVYMLDSYRT